ncbi:MAG: hypothetical protein ABSB32_20650 [Thermodesulfobacteriota bacterium]|jgi:hypothetical protein
MDESLCELKNHKKAGADKQDHTITEFLLGVNLAVHPKYLDFAL